MRIYLAGVWLPPRMMQRISGPSIWDAALRNMNFRAKSSPKPGATDCSAREVPRME